MSSCLDEDRWVYLWVDGVCSGLRCEATKLCTLVAIGVNERGQKKLLALEDGICAAAVTVLFILAAISVTRYVGSPPRPPQL